MIVHPRVHPHPHLKKKRRYRRLLGHSIKIATNSNGDVTDWDIAGDHLLTKWCQLDLNRCLMHPALCTRLNLTIRSNLTLKPSQQMVISHFLSDLNPATDPNANTHFLFSRFIFCCVFGPGGRVVQGLSAASCSVHSPMPLAQQSWPANTHSRVGWRSVPVEAASCNLEAIFFDLCVKLLHVWTFLLPDKAPCNIEDLSH